MAEVHKHILVKGFTNNNPGPESIAFLETWFKELVDQVDMKILVDPKVVWCDDEGNEGATGLVCITTSHASIHFWQEPEPYFQFDLYSCKDFYLEDIITMFRKIDVKSFAYTVMDRSGMIPVVSHSGYTYMEGE